MDSGDTSLTRAAIRSSRSWAAEIETADGAWRRKMAVIVEYPKPGNLIYVCHTQAVTNVRTKNTALTSLVTDREACLHKSLCLEAFVASVEKVQQPVQRTPNRCGASVCQQLQTSNGTIIIPLLFPCDRRRQARLLPAMRLLRLRSGLCSSWWQMKQALVCTYLQHSEPRHKVEIALRG